jgi:hypothetical protein
MAPCRIDFYGLMTSMAPNHGSSVEPGPGMLKSAALPTPDPCVARFPVILPRMPGMPRPRVYPGPSSWCTQVLDTPRSQYTAGQEHIQPTVQGTSGSNRSYGLPTRHAWGKTCEFWVPVWADLGQKLAWPDKIESRTARVFGPGSLGLAFHPSALAARPESAQTGAPKSKICSHASLVGRLYVPSRSTLVKLAPATISTE